MRPLGSDAVTIKPKLRFHVTGWRDVAASYAVVNQWQLLALMQRNDVQLTFSEAQSFWKPGGDIFSTTQIAALRAIPPADPGAIEGPEVEYRITYPFDFSPSQHSSTRRLLVFGTSENMGVKAPMFRGVPSLADLNSREGFTIVTPSDWSKAGFVATGVDDRRVVVVPHGVDTAIFRPDAELRQEVRAGLKLEGFVFLSIGAMTPNKGMVLLLQAFAALLESGKRAKLVLKGLDSVYGSTNHLRQTLANMTSRSRDLVLANMIYLGQAIGPDRLAALFNAADAYVSPYLAEGFNMPVLEAAACGLPIICTAGGPTDDFTRDDFRWNIDSLPVRDANGTHLRPSLDHLTALMGAMEANEAFRGEAKLRGPQFVRQGFQWDDVAEKLVSLGRG